jgi:beta-N-acetylhexosaminidase
VVVETLDTERPATLSRAALDVLRSELGYDGLVFTDDLEMKAVADHYTPERIAEDALAAGADVLLVCSRDDLRDAVLGALESMPHHRLEAPLERMSRFKAHWLARPSLAADSTPPYPAHLDLARRIV